MEKERRAKNKDVKKNEARELYEKQIKRRYRKGRENYKQLRENKARELGLQTALISKSISKILFLSRQSLLVLFCLFSLC